MRFPFVYAVAREGAVRKFPSTMTSRLSRQRAFWMLLLHALYTRQNIIYSHGSMQKSRSQFVFTNREEGPKALTTLADA